MKSQLSQESIECCVLMGLILRTFTLKLNIQTKQTKNPIWPPRVYDARVFSQHTFALVMSNLCRSVKGGGGECTTHPAPPALPNLTPRGGKYREGSVVKHGPDEITNIQKRHKKKSVYQVRKFHSENTLFLLHFFFVRYLQQNNRSVHLTD